MAYVDCYLIPLATSKLTAYERFSRQVAEVYREYGASRIADCRLDGAVANDAQFHAEEARAGLEGGGAPQRDFMISADARLGEMVTRSPPQAKSPLPLTTI